MAWQQLMLKDILPQKEFTKGNAAKIIFNLHSSIFNKKMWPENNNQLQKSFQFKDFVHAFAFMTRVAFVAEKMNHHPNMDKHLE